MKPHQTYHGCQNWTTIGCNCPDLDAQPATQGDEALTRWKCGNEFAPYHPAASHVDPDYRDGWNACFAASRAEVAALREALRVFAVRWNNTHGYWRCSECKATWDGIGVLEHHANGCLAAKP